VELTKPGKTAKGPAAAFTGDVYVNPAMSHLAMLEGTEDGDGTTWLEPVTDEQYTAANQT
jgi:hypothetical protein